MGFLYYASLLKFVLEGHYTLVLMERARLWMKAARVATPED
jgi:hypothetical protein